VTVVTPDELKSLRIENGTLEAVLRRTAPKSAATEYSYTCHCASAANCPSG
jgi:hypothetical protein